jgi:peroxiredoxin-like protein
MSDLPFSVTLDWHGNGRDGDGILGLGGAALTYSAPASMGGSGNGTNPEELLVAAVASCYSVTLAMLLRAAKLPVGRLAVRGEGLVSGFPSAMRFASIRVHPSIGGADPARREAYLEAARQARDRCFIGRSVRDSLDYSVGEVSVDP